MSGHYPDGCLGPPDDMASVETHDEPMWQSAAEEEREGAQYEHGLNELFAGEVAAPPVDLRRKRSAGTRPPFERIA